MKNNTINTRIEIIKYIIIFLFIIILFNLYKITIFENNIYKEKLSSLTNKIIEGPTAPRGRILDRNYNILVDNESIPTIYYQKENNISIEDEIELANILSKHLSLEYNKLLDRNLKEFYLLTSNIDRITKEEYRLLEERKLTNRDIYELKINRITNEELNNLTEDYKKTAYIYYLMNKGYSYQEKIIKEDATDEEYTYISENISKLKGINAKMSWRRIYPYNETFKMMLGNVSLIPNESKDEYLSKGYNISEKVGTSYIEKQYEEYLKGKNSTYIKLSSNEKKLISDEIRGNDIVLTIDINIQKEVEKILEEQLKRAKTEANTNFFNKTYVVIQEPNTGEVLAMSGKQIIKKNNKYIFNDVTSGILTDPMVPGSVIKGASMLVGYNTGAIKINEYMTDECIKIKSTPKKCSSHQVGRLNDIKALAESSNVYQFKIAIRVGNGNYKYNQPLKLDPEAFNIYRNIFKQFGLGTKTEIDLPIESLGYIGKSTETNHLLNLSMGQYDTYTPIQLSQYITTIASNGNRLKPHLLKEVKEKNNTKKIEPIILNKVETKEEYLKRIQEGFKAVMTVGLGRNVMGNAPNPAGKTGTSESFIDTDNDGIIDTETVSNAFVGYAPSDNPKMTITVTSPDVENPNTNISYHSYVNRRIAREISNKYFNIK